jgi:hypothetical protein
VAVDSGIVGWVIALEQLLPLLLLVRMVVFLALGMGVLSFRWEWSKHCRGLVGGARRDAED